MREKAPVYQGQIQLGLCKKVGAGCKHTQTLKACLVGPQMSNKFNEHIFGHCELSASFVQVSFNSIRAMSPQRHLPLQRGMQL